MLTVWWPHKLKTVADANVNISNSSATFKAEIDSAGNSTNYKYQWYVSASSDLSEVGNKIDGETSATYTVTPSRNVNEEYYYCVVTNYDGNTPLYNVSTNRAKLVADISRPNLSIGTITVDPETTSHNNLVYVNKSFTLTVPFTIEDEGVGINEDDKNFTADDIKVLVAGSAASCDKTMTHSKVNNNKVNYTLTLKNIQGNGALSFHVDEGNDTAAMPTTGFRDIMGNANESYHFTTFYMIDNTKPVISQHTYVSGANEKYVNKAKVLAITFAIREVNGIETDEFTVEDLIIKINGSEANSDVIKNMSYTERAGNDFIFQLYLENLNGSSDGVLSINIAGEVPDWATNEIDEVEIPVMLNDRETQIVVDNTPPKLTNIKTEFNNFGSNALYPNSLASWHENWAKQDIFVTLTATDTYEIDYYETSKNQGNSYSKLESNQEQLTNEFNNYVWYRVADKAGNYSENLETAGNAYRVMIKIDKTMPKATELGMYELRLNGVKYVFDSERPANRNIVVRPLESSDLGTVKSDIAKTPITSPTGSETAPAVKYKSASDGSGVYGTYYVVTHYQLGTNNQLYEKTYTIEDTAETLIEDGNYEVRVVTTDKAGNCVESPLYKIFISKSQSNRIKISNITDVGSGVGNLVVNVYRADNSDNKVGSPIQTFSVDNPGQTYETTLRLGRGKFYVELLLYDKSVNPDNGYHNSRAYHKVIENEF